MTIEANGGDQLAEYYGVDISAASEVLTPTLPIDDRSFHVNEPTLARLSHLVREGATPEEVSGLAVPTKELAVKHPILRNIGHITVCVGCRNIMVELAGSRSFTEQLKTT